MILEVKLRTKESGAVKELKSWLPPTNPVRKLKSQTTELHKYSFFSHDSAPLVY